MRHDLPEPPGSLNPPRPCVIPSCSRQVRRNELGGNGNQSSRASSANHAQPPVKTAAPSLSHCVTPSLSLSSPCVTELSPRRPLLHSPVILLMPLQRCHFILLLFVVPLFPSVSPALSSFFSLTYKHTVVFPSLQRTLHWLTFISWGLFLTLHMTTQTY